MKHSTTVKILVGGLKLPAVLLAFVLAALAGTAAAQQVTVSKQDRRTNSPPCSDEETAKLPQPRYIGLWRPASGLEDRREFASWTDLVELHQLRPQSRLIDLETFTSEGARRYAAVWRTGAGGGDELSSDPSLEAFAATRAAREAAGFGLIELEVVPQGGGEQVLAVWRPGTPSTELLLADSASGFETAFAAQAASHVLLDVETWVAAGQRHFLGVLRARALQDGAQKLEAAQQWCAFHDDYHDLVSSHRLDDLEFYVDGQGARRYVAYWTEGSGADHLWIGYTSEGEYGFDKAGQQLSKLTSPLRLVDLEILDEVQAPGESPVRVTRLRAPERTENPARVASRGRSASDVIKVPDDDPVINGSPVLHDTGSSGPD